LQVNSYHQNIGCINFTILVIVDIITFICINNFGKGLKEMLNSQVEIREINDTGEEDVSMQKV